MKTIWKFPVPVTDTFALRMPRDATILCVQVQGEQPCLWAEVDDEARSEDRLFEVFGTGHRMHVDMGVSRAYIGTFQLHGGSLVFHLYERTA